MNIHNFKKIKLPDKPGVYFFLDEVKEIIYIGRATSLKDRVRSYFNDDVIHTRGALIVDMVTRAHTIEYTVTDSVLEAIILEANLIKKYQPHANVKEKDDKSFNYVVITNEEFPKILLVREKELTASLSGYAQNRAEAINPVLGHTPAAGLSAKAGVGRFHKGVDGLGHFGELPGESRAMFGPFPYGAILKDGLKIVRKIFPYRDNKCKLGKPCFNFQIGLCPGPCAGAISKEEYEKTIRSITLFFEGRKGELLKNLQKEMKTYAKAKEFEKANEVKKTLFALTHIQDAQLIKHPSLASTQVAPSAKGDSFRIEGYDIAHMSGQNNAGVMVVLEDNHIKKSDYRLFKIKRKKGADDIANLKEVLERRLAHTEWTFPSLIVVDGNSVQKNTAEMILSERNLNIPVVAVTKNDKHKPENILGDSTLVEKYRREILLINSEAHRFAIKYHRKLRTPRLK